MEDKKNSILIIGSSEVAYETMSKPLSKLCHVSSASDGDEALNILHNNYIDLVLANYNMQKMNALDLFDRINEKFPGVGKVLITAFYSDAKAVVDAMNSGLVDRCIGKPWDNEQDLPIIQELMISLEKKKLEAQMIHNSKLASLGELAAGIVHELNNPLTFIDANLKNLHKFLTKVIGMFDSYDDLNVPEGTRQEIEKRKKEINYDYLRNRMTEMIDKSRTGTDRMKKIITDMKSISRQSDIKYEESDINESIDSTLTVISHEYKNRIEINKEYGDLPLVKCNITKLSQVFMNLLVNACHAIKEKGEIKIKTSIEEEMAVISISDNGGGIPENLKNKIFESFFTTKAVGKGTGLGLSISKRIIDQHKGEILLDSKMGEGTTFTIKIPTKPEGEEGK